MPGMKPLLVRALLFLLCLAPVLRAETPAPDTFDTRAQAALDAALADPKKLTGMSPMHFWVAQRLLEQGRDEEAVRIISGGVGYMRDFIAKRVKENHNNIGSNGFLYWSALNAYVRWHERFPESLKQDYRYVFTTAKNYKGTTGNLSMIHTLALFLADNIWGAENLPKDGNFGARGPGAVKWLGERVERTAKRGSGEFASRPYMLYNIGTLLTLDNDYVDPLLRRKAVMAYEMSIAHAAGTWLRGHWAVSAGRSYPDQLTQQPSGSAALLWTYFGGVTPRLDAGSAAIFAAGEKFRPHPLIVKAATDRAQPYVSRSRFDGDKQFQTTFMNRTHALFSTAVLPGTSVWGQTYPYGVMWDEPDPAKGSHLWLTVPIDDETRLGYHTHGINGRAVQFAQHRGSLVMVTAPLENPKFKYQHVLGYIPGGWRAMVNDSAADGRIFLHYGSVLIALVADAPFAWDPASGVRCGSPRKTDSEFRITRPRVAMGLETAMPADFPGATPAEQLDAFRAAVKARSILTLRDATATFTDRDGVALARAFDGDTTVNGERVAYETWPLLENPWMRQEWEGNLVITDGVTKRVYDVKEWTVTDSPASEGK